MTRKFDSRRWCMIWARERRRGREWPSHRGHEERSVALIEALAARLRIPSDYRELALIVARYHGIVHRAFELRPKTILEFMERADAFRRPERFAQALLACEADSRGRTGLENEPVSAARLFARRPRRGGGRQAGAGGHRDELRPENRGRTASQPHSRHRRGSRPVRRRCARRESVCGRALPRGCGADP